LLNHEPANKLVIEDLCRAAGIPRVQVVKPRLGSNDFENLLTECLSGDQLAVIIVRRPCLLIGKQFKAAEKLAVAAAAESCDAAKKGESCGS